MGSFRVNKNLKELTPPKSRFLAKIGHAGPALQAFFSDAEVFSRRNNFILFVVVQCTMYNVHRVYNCTQSV